MYIHALTHSPLGNLSELKQWIWNNSLHFTGIIKCSELKEEEEEEEEEKEEENEERGGGGGGRGEEEQKRRELKWYMWYGQLGKDMFWVTIHVHHTWQ